MSDQGKYKFYRTTYLFTSLIESIKSNFNPAIIVVTIMIFTIIDGSSNPYVAAPLGGNMTAGPVGPLGGNMTARPVGPLGSSDRHHVFNIPHPSPTLRCPSGEHPSGHQCVSNITNRPIPCPLNQHVTPQGICVSNITNR